ncbi:hypothetical protein QBC38DRAFT_429934 [Podospora fimiseda]|uniref:G domain-containing protein n=1 Tax=Podospora fimiseda TaxID=252190 RepID=A0AAN7BEL1_9PEZI|nr:hypothetical protein QBC38DRAFT_429934 [Podospora fimiseda]
MDQHGIVLVMGITGAGKSSFINLLKPDAVSVGHGLASETKKLQAVQINLDSSNQRSITMIDTPGFDDSDLGVFNDAGIFEEIITHLTAQYALKIPLRGIVYLHLINEVRFKGSGKKYLRVLERLVDGCGMLDSLILLTSQWGGVNEADGIRREQELMTKYWAPLIKRGAHAYRFPRTREEATSMILRLVTSNNNLVLSIQKELIDKESRVSGGMDAKTWFKQEFGREMDGTIAEKVLEKTKKEKKRFWHRIYGHKGGVRIFASIFGFVLTVVGYVAAFGGVSGQP